LKILDFKTFGTEESLFMKSFFNSPFNFKKSSFIEEFSKKLGKLNYETIENLTEVLVLLQI